VAKNTAAISLYFGGFFALFYFFSGAERNSDESVDRLRVLGAAASFFFLTSATACLGWFACVLADARRSEGEPLRPQPGTSPLEPETGVIPGGVRRRSARLRVRAPQIARAHNWREYFWRVMKKAWLAFLIGTAVFVPVMLNTGQQPPNWLAVLGGLASLASFGGFLIGFVSTLLWLWCVLLDAIISAADAARTRRAALQRPPLTLEGGSTEEDAPLPLRVSDHSETEGQFRQGLPGWRSEGFQE
jgi:hypothetical protein